MTQHQGRNQDQPMGQFQQEVGTVIDSTQTMWQKCIEACNRCMQACEQCLSSCLQEPDVQDRLHCIGILRDCADICSLAASFMARGSSYAQQLCSLCADICDACAAECAKFEDHHCQECAQYCRDCATECRKMAS